MNRVMAFKGFLVLLGVILIVFLPFHFIMKGNIHSLNDILEERKLEWARKEEEHQNLTSQLGMVGTDVYIAQSAMEQYDYMKQDDFQFQFTNPEVLDRYTPEEKEIYLEEMAY